MTREGYPSFRVTSATPIDQEMSFTGIFDPAPSFDPITVTFGISYLLVPSEDCERAFHSLQDAGEAAGVPPCRNIIRYLQSQSLYVVALEAAIAEAMNTFRAQSNAAALEKLEGVLDDKEKWGTDRYEL